MSSGMNVQIWATCSWLCYATFLYNKDTINEISLNFDVDKGLSRKFKHKTQEYCTVSWKSK